MPNLTATSRTRPESTSQIADTRASFSARPHAGRCLRVAISPVPMTPTRSIFLQQQLRSSLLTMIADTQVHRPSQRSNCAVSDHVYEERLHRGSLYFKNY